MCKTPDIPPPPPPPQEVKTADTAALRRKKPMNAGSMLAPLPAGPQGSLNTGGATLLGG